FGGLVLTVLPLIGAADFCWREGQTIDCGLFVIAGQPGGAVFPIFRHLLNIFPVVFLFNLIFFLLGHGASWWSQERVYRNVERDRPELLTQVVPHSQTPPAPLISL